MWICDQQNNSVSIESVCMSENEGKCKDRTDLSFCACGEGKWLCVQNKKCIPADEVCNGEDDCSNDSDENKSFCENLWTCKEHHTYIAGEIIVEFCCPVKSVLFVSLDELCR